MSSPTGSTTHNNATSPNGAPTTLELGSPMTQPISTPPTITTPSLSIGTTTTTTPIIPSTTINTTHTATSPSSSTTNILSPTQPPKTLDFVILGYLEQRGYLKSQQILKQELMNVSNSTTTSANPLSSPLSPSSTSNNNNTSENVDNLQHFLLAELNKTRNYLDSYKKLRNWIHSSLDIYKNELLSILYPIFVHSYIDLISKGFPEQARELMNQISPEHEDYFGDDLQLLRGISNTDHLKENELVDMFRNNRWNIKMCAYSYELLLTFLHESNLIQLVGTINQYININVTNLRPGFIDDEQYSISFQSEKDAGNLNSIPINYHAFKPDYEEELNPTAPTATATTTTTAIGGASGTTAADAASIVNASDPNSSKKKKDKKKKEVVDERMLKSQSNVPLPVLTEKFEAELKEDFTKCVSLSASNLPSICFYTIFNTYQGLNTIDISKDASLVAGGFSDSSVKVWNLKEMSEKKQQQQQQQTNEKETSNNTSPTSTPTITSNGKGKHQNNILNVHVKKKDSEFKSFLGHSGPVYGTSFSPDAQYLLSCSEDTTVRLWSMETMTNLVCYKGHNFPVWDVSFSPFGFYFATASHDRTARLWSTNHPSPLRIFTGHLSDTNCVKFHPNINYVATGSSDKSARLWEMQTGKCVRIFMGHRAPVYTVAFSPDGRLMATAGEDTSIILWDLSTGKKVKKMDGHIKCVYSLDFSTDGSILASGSSDCTVRLWDVKKAYTNSLATIPTTSAEANSVKNNKRKSIKSKLFCEELLETFPTKQTPVYNVSFSRRNLLLAAGSFTTSTSFDSFY
ncbi:hypothetical protein CYY_002793 [Polysphondylium violaceum]|uniref:Transcription initiation factor TFIID subunit 5 n=1 Tax=Polysphondylium violaceum TaxID=133409 RepID=A0A8J4V6J8_9MYCE|nr:hypothetical protein CYY_002793 [Polysphondylium violaceum]